MPLSQSKAAGIIYRFGNSVLLLLRGASAPDFPLHWDLPGGHREEGETAEQAAIRESQEETGFAPAAPLALFNYGQEYATFCVDVPEAFAPVLCPEHLGYAWSPLDALPSPLHPGLAEVLAGLPVAVAVVAEGTDAREVDGNGWVEVKSNPISKAGVFPYSGAQIGLTGAEANKIFNVLRPPEELSDPECLASFRLIPWVDEHTMLGPTAEEMTDKALPAEKKGIQGVIGEEVFFKEGVLYANIKVFSNTLASLIEAGKRELSAGYRCIYELTAGTWEGVHYDAVQRKIRGNHLALVKEGRMGPDVAVMDTFKFTVDSKELKMEDEEKKCTDAAPTLEELAAQVKALAEAVAALKKPAEETEDAEETPEAKAEETPEAKAEEDGGEGTPAGAGMDERVIIARIAKRDVLAAKISRQVGTFDHASMTLDDVVDYGCNKLGIKASKPLKAATLEGFLQASPAVTPTPTVAGMDSSAPARGENFVTKHLKKGEK